MSNMKNSEYCTKDFYSACILRAFGVQFRRIERGDNRFVVFVFEDGGGEADKTISRYWNRQLPVEAKDLVDAIHDMKSILYSNK